MVGSFGWIVFFIPKTYKISTSSKYHRTDNELYESQPNRVIIVHFIAYIHDYMTYATTIQLFSGPSVSTLQTSSILLSAQIVNNMQKYDITFS